MLIVLPFHAGDEWLALKNLELCKKLDGKVSNTCLLAYDSITDPAAVARLAAECFSEVKHFKYDKWTGEKTWPAPQNWAWQSVVRYIWDHCKDKPWFWWEADVTPVSAGWISRLEEEYKRGGLPFMGHIVPVMNHMNGVAVYPGDVLRHAGEALLSQKHPFDIMLSHSIPNLVHRANALMAHFPRYTGVTLSFTDVEALKKLQARGAVIFHGCNDGTLVDLMAGDIPERKPSGILQRDFTIRDIDAPFNEAEMFWQKDCIGLKKKGHPVALFEECSRELNGFAQQTKWDAGQFNLPLSEEVCHFNPGLVRDDGGRLWLLARRWDRIKNTYRNWLVGWNSSLIACQLDNDLNVISQKKLDIRKRQRGEQHEDPRVVWHNGAFWVSYCSWAHGAKYSAKQEFSKFDANWNFQGNAHINYGNNPIHSAGHEKNWIFFNHDNAWHMVYNFSPHIVVRIGANGQAAQEFKTDTNPMWAYGEIRGGTPPVRVGDEYISFFHSSMYWKGRQKRYYMGSYKFEAKPPFKVTHVTPKPLLAGSDQDTRINGGPPCIFSCGSAFENKEWLVTFGVNDEACGWVRIPHRNLEKRMVSV